MSLAGFLMAWASSSTTLPHVDLLERVDVAHSGAVGGDHEVGVRRHGLDARRRRPVRSVVDLDLETRGEAARLRRPSCRRPPEVRSPAPGRGPSRAEVRRAWSGSCRAPCRGRDSRRGPTGRGSSARRGPRPGSAELALESLGARGERRRDVAGTAEQIGGPALATERDPAFERRTLESEGMSQHVGARELRRVGSVGQRRVRRRRGRPCRARPTGPVTGPGVGLRSPGRGCPRR